MHPGKGIKDILAAANLLTGWKVELGDLPDVDQAIGIMDTGGRAPEPRLSINYPSVQILVLADRSPTGYLVGWTKCEEIRNALLGIPAGPAAYPELTMCNQIGDIVPLGRNDNNRPKFSLNFQLITEPTPTGYRESA